MTDFAGSKLEALCESLEWEFGSDSHDKLVQELAEAKATIARLLAENQRLHRAREWAAKREVVRAAMLQSEQATHH